MLLLFHAYILPLDDRLGQWTLLFAGRSVYVMPMRHLVWTRAICHVTAASTDEGGRCIAHDTETRHVLGGQKKDILDADGPRRVGEGKTKKHTIRLYQHVVSCDMKR
jgi:hypothetical protein